MFDACLPLGPCVTSKETFWPSLSVLKPCILIAEKWAKRSSPPPSGVMKPKPFASLNHLTVPVDILSFLKIERWAEPVRGLSQSPRRTNEHQIEDLKYLGNRLRAQYTDPGGASSGIC